MALAKKPETILEHLKEVAKKVNPNLTDEEIEKRLTSGRMRQFVTTLGREVVKSITCTKCGDRIVSLDKNENVAIEYPKYLGRRLRFDGNWGYECRCGNDSRVSKGEIMVMPGPKDKDDKETPSLERPPTQEQLNDIFDAIKKNPAKIIEHKAGVTEVDGFVTEVI